MLRVEAAVKSFEGFLAVNGADLTVEKGEIVAVIGPNGAGKTTLFNLITGQLHPNGGKILFKGENIGGLPPHQICSKGISRSFQIENVFHRLTVLENVQVAVISHLKKSYRFFSPSRKLGVDEALQILEDIGLSDKAARISGSLSHGDRKVLEIAIALGNDPELLVLDEPTAGLSPEETSSIIALINRLSREMGLTILLCEHNMELVFSVAHRIMVMQQGASIFQGKPVEARNNRQVQEAYLGGPA
jgi:branched-chain amino acid transport system ATP-binding protein